MRITKEQEMLAVGLRFWLSPHGWWTALSTGSSFSTSQFGIWSTAVTWVDVAGADINNDKFTDIVGRVSTTGQWWAAISNGSTFTEQLWTTWVP